MKKSKVLLSALTLVAFALLGGGSDDDTMNVFWIILVILVVLFIILAIVGSNENEKKQQEELAKELKQRQQQAEAKAQYENAKAQFFAEHGTPDKSISIKEMDLSSDIHCFGEAKKIFILGQEYNFADIVSCSFTDSPRTKKGKVTAVTKSNTGSVIGRSIVGDVVAGPTGAIIGGSTAKKNTEYVQDDDILIHDYTGVININNISTPIISIHTGSNEELTNEIVGLMNVVIARK